MSVTVFASNDACRRHLRDEGYKKLRTQAEGTPEYWWKSGSAAEVALSRVFIYPVQSKGYQEASELASRPTIDAFWEYYGIAKHVEAPLPFVPGTIDTPIEAKRKRVVKIDRKKRCFNGHIINSKNVRKDGSCAVCRTSYERSYLARKRDIQAWENLGQRPVCV